MAEAESFELIIAADENLKYQQNLKSRCIGLIVLGSNRWTKLALQAAQGAVDLPLPYAGPFSVGHPNFLRPCRNSKSCFDRFPPSNTNLGIITQPKPFASAEIV